MPSTMGESSRPAWLRPVNVSVAVVFVVTVLVAWMIHAAREASIREMDRRHFAGVGMSLVYCSEYRGRLPYPVVTQQSTWHSTEDSARNRADRPLYSWRVEIWPYLEGWKDPWDPSQPWDHPLNKKLAVFSSFYSYEASRRADNQPFPETNLLAITGPGTAFGDGTAPPMALKNVPPNTILVVETRASGIPWPAPGDFDIRTMPQTINAPDGKGISGRSAGGFHLIFADGKLWFLSDKTPFETLSKFFTTTEAGKHDRDELLKPFVLHRGI